jgi:diguanylate cyclase (GGDEF)-like protein
VAQFVFDASASPSYVSDIMRRIGRAERYIKEALPVLEAKRLMSTLKESSLKDPMTGLYNRRFLEEYVDTLVATVNRRSTILGLMMCDLDFFKQVNDTYGHNVGDTVLKETSAIIRNSVRASDIVVRYGGEEFLVLLKDLKGDEVARIAEKIRDKVAQTKVKISGGFVQKTISIGIAEFPKDTSNFWQGVKYSDVALYKAKQTGRNRVVRFDPSMWTEETY